MSIIKTENIDVSFGDLHVLKGVSLEVQPKEVVCIIGPSGAGKSTFLRTLNGLEKFSSGKIFVDDNLLDEYENGNHIFKMPKNIFLKWEWFSRDSISSLIKQFCRT